MPKPRIHERDVENPARVLVRAAIIFGQSFVQQRGTGQDRNRREICRQPRVARDPARAGVVV